jgi:hypothetical protein
MRGKCKAMRLSPVALGLAVGVLSGVYMWVFAWVGMRWGFGMDIIKMWGTVFPGFEATMKGAFYGLAGGFIDGVVCGLIVAWIYNLCLCCCASSGCCCSSSCNCEGKNGSSCQTK